MAWVLPNWTGYKISSASCQKTNQWILPGRKGKVLHLSVSWAWKVHHRLLIHYIPLNILVSKLASDAKDKDKLYNEIHKGSQKTSRDAQYWWSELVCPPYATKKEWRQICWCLPRIWWSTHAIRFLWSQRPIMICHASPQTQLTSIEPTLSVFLSTTGKITSFNNWLHGQEDFNCLNDGKACVTPPINLSWMWSAHARSEYSRLMDNLKDVTSMECIAHMGWPLSVTSCFSGSSSHFLDGVHFMTVVMKNTVGPLQFAQLKLLCGQPGDQGLSDVQLYTLLLQCLVLDINTPQYLFNSKSPLMPCEPCMSKSEPHLCLCGDQRWNQISVQCCIFFLEVFWLKPSQLTSKLPNGHFLLFGLHLCECVMDCHTITDACQLYVCFPTVLAQSPQLHLCLSLAVLGSSLYSTWQFFLNHTLLYILCSDLVRGLHNPWEDSKKAQDCKKSGLTASIPWWSSEDVILAWRYQWSIHRFML